MELNCKQCKKIIVTYPSLIKTKKFCSRKCKGVWMKDHHVPSNKGQKGWTNRGSFKKGHSYLGDGHEWFKIGKTSFMKGKHHTLAAKEKLSNAFKGSKSFLWQGGICNDEYGSDFDSPLKEQVRLREKYKCKICGCSQVENGRRLDVHHIDYDKKNCTLNNLVSLCRSCHVKTNTNRQYWIKRFSGIAWGIKK